MYLCILFCILVDTYMFPKQVRATAAVLILPYAAIPTRVKIRCSDESNISVLLLLLLLLNRVRFTIRDRCVYRVV